MKKTIFIFGAITTVATLFFTLYPLHGTNVHVFKIAFGSIFSTILLSALATLYYRKINNGYASFRDLFLVSLGALTFGSIAATIITIIYFGTLSEETKMLIENNVLETQLQSLPNLSNSIIIQERMEMETAKIFNLSRQIIGIPISIVFSAVFSAIVALCVKKEVRRERETSIINASEEKR